MYPPRIGDVGRLDALLYLHLVICDDLLSGFFLFFFSP